jgi:hypothetical protein
VAEDGLSNKKRTFSSIKEHAGIRNKTHGFNHQNQSDERRRMGRIVPHPLAGVTKRGGCLSAENILVDLALEGFFGLSTLVV